MIVFGIVLLIIGYVAHIAMVWTIGIIVLIVGAVLALVGRGGRRIGGRSHWY